MRVKYGWLVATAMIGISAFAIWNSKKSDLSKKRPYFAKSSGIPVLLLRSGQSIKLLPLLTRNVPPVTLVPTLGSIEKGTYTAPKLLLPTGIDDIEMQNADTGEPLGRICIQIADEGTEVFGKRRLPSTTVDKIPGLRLPIVKAKDGVHPLLSDQAQLLGESKEPLWMATKFNFNPPENWVFRTAQVEGDVRVINSPEIQLKRGPSVPVNLTIEASAGLLQSKLPVSYEKSVAISVIHQDVYHSIGGKWRYSHSKKLVKDGCFGSQFSSPAARIYLGYSNNPAYKFGNGPAQISSF